MSRKDSPVESSSSLPTAGTLKHSVLLTIFRAQQSVKLFLMEHFGRNIFQEKKENHDIESNLTEASEESSVLASLKSAAVDLGN